MNKNIFINEVSKLLYEKRAVYFVGAGISKPSKFKDWLANPDSENLNRYKIRKTLIVVTAIYFLVTTIILLNIYDSK